MKKKKVKEWNEEKNKKKKKQKRKRMKYDSRWLLVVVSMKCGIRRFWNGQRYFLWILALLPFVHNFRYFSKPNTPSHTYNNTIYRSCTFYISGFKYYNRVQKIIPIRLIKNRYTFCLWKTTGNWQLAKVEKCHVMLCIRFYVNGKCTLYISTAWNMEKCSFEAFSFIRLYFILPLYTALYSSAHKKKYNNNENSNGERAKRRRKNDISYVVNCDINTLIR